ncbi:MAG TPA: hypothetical protein VIF14_17830 [Alphaproteobacteria bacterium]|jgi:hypothetical protein
MKTKLLTLAAVAALAIGAGAASAATPTAPGADIGPRVSTDSGVEPAGYYWRYREFWRGRCKFKTLYVTNGYRWAYRYRYRCF